jgi:hypothetical protein
VLSLLLMMIVLLVVSGAFLVRPLLAEEPAAGGDAPVEVEPGVSSLSPEERRQAIDELLWRLDHDLATGRIDDDEHRRLRARAEQAQRAGRSRPAP